jgi:hypothetical protein
MEWNFKHPLLMLEAANLAIEVFDTPADPREIVQAGRFASAALASIGVVALAIAGYLAYGTAGLLIGGLTMALCPYLLVYAHYLKEDASLVAGIMLAVLGARLVISAPDEFTQLLATIVLGIGAGAAASGKFVGAGVVVPCLFTLCIARVPHWWTVPTRLILFAVVAVGTVIFINQRAFLDWTSLELLPQAQVGLNEEYRHGRAGHNSLTLPVPNTWCLKTSVGEMMPHLWAMVGAGALWIILRRKIGRWGLVVGAFLLTFIVELSYNTIIFARYALPITVLMYFAASQLAASLVSDLQKKTIWGHAVLAGCVAVIVGLQGWRCWRFTEYFRDDSRQRAREWIAANVPSGSMIVADYYADLHSAGDPWRFPNQPHLTQRINVGGMFASANGGSAQDLANRGVDYVVAASCSYQRFFEPVQAMGGYDSWLTRNRGFYEDIFKNGELVWHFAPDPDTHSYVNMEIRVYKISQLATRQNNSGSGGILRNLFR